MAPLPKREVTEEKEEEPVHQHVKSTSAGETELGELYIVGAHRKFNLL